MLSHPEAEIVARDPALPQLSILLDAEHFAPLIRENAPETNATEVSLTYLRYKPGVNCVAGYEYLAGEDVRYAYAKIFSADQADKRDKSAARSGLPGGASGIVVAFFPNDAKLRSMKRLDGGPREKRFIRRVFSNHERLWNGVIETIRYKPERRLVTRLVCENRNEAVVKIHAESRYSRLRNNDKQFKSRENLLTAQRMGHSDRHHVLAFEWLPGKLLSDGMKAGELEADVLLSVGRALACIHAQHTDDLLLNSPTILAGHLGAVAGQIGFLCPNLADAAEQTARRIGALLQTAPAEYAAIHGDFYANQVLLHGDLVGVLDFDESAYADPMADIGNFLAHLEWDRFCCDRSTDTLDNYRSALMEGYSRTGRSLDRQRIELFRAAGLFRLLPHPFRFREQNWSERTAVLLDRTRQALADAAVSTHAAKTRAKKGSLPDICTRTGSVLPDEAMPFLPAALDCKAALPVLRKALQSRFPERVLKAISRAHLFRHKPGRRALIEYSLQLHDQSGTPIELPVLGKVRAKGTDISTYELMRALWEEDFHDASPDGLFVPEPLGVAPTFHMWFQRKVEGSTATERLDRPGGPAVARDIARALHKLHASGPPPRSTHSMQDELAILNERLALVAEIHPYWSGRIAGVYASCRATASELPETRLGPIHRDFYPDNILVAASGVHLLDLDLYSFGDPALDVGNFTAHVMEYSLRTHRDYRALEACTRAFEDEYVALTGEYIRPSIDIYTTLSLVRHIHISTLFPVRKRFTGALLALCERRLEANSKGSTPQSDHIR